MTHLIDTGGCIPGTQDPAFSVWRPRRETSPIVLAAPHGGRNYPPDVLANVRGSEPASPLLRLEDRLIDGIAAKLASQTGTHLVVAHAPRAVIDLNRAPDDLDWGMVRGAAKGKGAHSRRSRAGLGLIPRRLSGSGELWKRPLEPHDLERRIDHIHRPYHATLDGIMTEVRDRWGIAVLIDLHSMPPLKPAPGGAAEFVIGDRFGMSAHHALSARALDVLGKAGRRAAHNRPYAGGYVLERHGDTRRSLHALQIEICRTCYLDRNFSRPSARMAGIVQLLSVLTRQLADEAVTLAHPDRFAKAAE